MKKLILGILLLYTQLPINAQIRQAISKEVDVPVYSLPDVLTSVKGKKIKSIKTWEKIRRAEILKLYRDEMFGKVPGELKISDAHVWDNDDEALDGKAIRKQVGLTFRKNGRELYMEVLMYLPKNITNFPIFLGYNFMGNHTVVYDPDIRLTASWVRDNPAFGIIHNQVTEQSRGVAGSRWQIERIIAEGCGIATVYYGDVDPDHNDFENGIHPLFYTGSQNQPEDDQWGSIAAWAWGLSRVLDYFETDSDIDATKVVVFGHSRLGKTALWAGATDQRFAAVISNDSGCGGAALFRRQFGETLGVMNRNFPHWLCKNIIKYNNNEGSLPFDQHMLLALIAPRPLYVASATEDLWADPRGEFLSAKYASPVYKLYELEGFPCEDMPEADFPVTGNICYHIRSGKHDITPFDWEQYIRFAKSNL